MIMTINESTRVATAEVKFLTGSLTDVEVANGKTLSMETTPGGVEFLSRAPAVGKKWIKGVISISFEEVDI